MPIILGLPEIGLPGAMATLTRRVINSSALRRSERRVPVSTSLTLGIASPMTPGRSTGAWKPCRLRSAVE